MAGLLRGGVAAFGLVVFVLVFGLVALWSRPALAYCRTTTCSVPCPPPECLSAGASADSACASSCPPARCLATDADHCLTQGIPVSWRRRCLSFSVEATGSSRLGMDYDQLLLVVQGAFGLWPQAACTGGSPSFGVISLGRLTCNMREYNPTGPNANGVIFRDDSWSYGSEVIGLTSVSINTSTGEIRGADMEINTFDYGAEFTPAGLAYTVAHESGHFFGLAHSSQASALMYERASASTTIPPVLTADDTAAICAVYPPLPPSSAAPSSAAPSSAAPSSAAPMCDPDPLVGAFEPAKGFAPDCGGDVTAACALSPGTAADGPSIALVAAALLVLVARRPRAV